LKVDEDLYSRQDENLNIRAQEFKNERYEIFLGGVLCAMTSQIDTNKYEDFARAILGSKAYLLFSYDKLITSVS
jgi:hypothetical protein